jgi:hypothetical protein
MIDLCSPKDLRLPCVRLIVLGSKSRLFLLTPQEPYAFYDVRCGLGRGEGEGGSEERGREGVTSKGQHGSHD